MGEVAAGVGAIGATLAGIGVAAIATPVIVPLSAAGAAVGIGCFLVGAASGYLISHGLRH